MVCCTCNIGYFILCYGKKDVKKGDQQEEKNYRPITSLISVNKIFDQLLSNQITGHYDPTLYNRMTAYKKK